MIGLSDAKDIYEGIYNGNNCQSQYSCHEQAEEHLCRHMNGMSDERAIVHPFAADNQQNGCKDIGEKES